MADSIEQKIIAAMVSRLQGINGTGSFLTTLATNAVGITGGNVADSKPDWDAGDEDRTTQLPAISIFQGATKSEEQPDEGNFTLRQMNVMIRGFLKRSTDAATARKFIADVMRAIRSDDTWIVSGTPLARFSTEESHSIDYAPDTFEVTGVTVEISIFYIGSKFNLEA
jgi:hypothetical protein